MTTLAPETFGEAIRSLPRTFRAERAAEDVARVHISTVGPEPGNWMVTVRNGSCYVEEGSFVDTNLRIHIPSDIALAIIRGEIDGGRAFDQGFFVINGELDILRKFGDWFGHAAPER